MKKTSIVIIALVAFPFLFTTTLATSGACSYHSGVNCSAGPNSYGKVTCNDGWVNSSVLFSDTDECKVVDTCPGIISGSACTNESDYARVQQQVDAMRGSQRAMNARSGLLGSPMDTSASIGQDKLDSCRQAINLYDRMVLAHEQCESKRMDQLNQQAQSSADYVQLKLNAFCAKYNGAGSVWNASLPPDNITAQCTPSIDQLFQKHFKIAMDGLPTQYRNAVDPNLIKALSLNPANANKTFSQIITETYPNAMNATSTFDPAKYGAIPVSGTSTKASSSPGKTTWRILALPSPNAFAVNQNLGIGASGNDVVQLQKFLASKNFLALPAGTTEGYFGNLTKQALIAFQKSVGLPTTGYCGPMTRAAISGSK